MGKFDGFACNENNRNWERLTKRVDPFYIHEKRIPEIPFKEIIHGFCIHKDIDA